MKRDSKGRFVSKGRNKEPAEKFFPLPWELGEGCIIKDDRIIITVHDYYNDRERCLATAALIHAAPRMYAELKDLLDAMESGCFPQVAPGVDYPAVMEKKWELRKLLKEARGEK